MLQTDSLQVNYFKSPDEPGLFKYTSVNDPAFISTLVKDVQKKFSRKIAVRRKARSTAIKREKYLILFSLPTSGTNA